MTYIPTSDFYHLVQSGQVPGHDIVNKFGRNPDTDSPQEDVWNEGGTYTGFPVGAPETVQVVSSSASDTGVLTFTYLATSSSTAWQTATVTLNGTTPVNASVSAYRVHTAYYDTGDDTTFNVGDITVRHATTTANVFLTIPVGRSQSNASAYTVPAGHTGYIIRMFGETVGGTSSNNAGFALRVREFGKSPRLRRPHSTNEGDRFDEIIAGGLVLPEKSDIILQATVTSNNLQIIGGYDIMVVANT